jgi:hypothetical protein
MEAWNELASHVSRNVPAISEGGALATRMEKLT